MRGVGKQIQTSQSFRPPFPISLHRPYNRPNANLRMEATAHIHDSATTEIQEQLQKQLIAAFARRIDDNDGLFWGKFFTVAKVSDAPPERNNILSDDVELSCALRFAEAIEDWESSIPTAFSNPDESDITNNPAPQYESTRWLGRALKNQVANVVRHYRSNSYYFGRSCRRRIRRGSRRPTLMSTLFKFGP